MARHMGIVLSATLAVFMMSGRTVNAEIEETDRMLADAGPQLIELNRCYEREANLKDISCSSLSKNVESVLLTCRFDEIGLQMALLRSSRSRPVVEKLVSELRYRARIKIEKQFTKFERVPRPCVHLL